MFGKLSKRPRRKFTAPILQVEGRAVGNHKLKASSWKSQARGRRASSWKSQVTSRRASSWKSQVTSRRASSWKSQARSRRASRCCRSKIALRPRVKCVKMRCFEPDLRQKVTDRSQEDPSSFLRYNSVSQSCSCPSTKIPHQRPLSALNISCPVLLRFSVYIDRPEHHLAVLRPFHNRVHLLLPL